MIVDVPEQKVRISGKQPQTVRRFAITSSPISAAEFALFAKRTGYVTTAEREQQEYSVYSNPSLSGVTFADQQLVPALFVGRADVAAFCDYNRVTLPTPVQWVAFLQHISKHRLFALKNAKEGDEPQLKTHFSCREWLKSDRLLGGPPMVQLPGVPSKSSPSDLVVLHDSNSGDISITFRVVIEQ